MRPAIRCCELTDWKNPVNLAILAAVDSENGDFAEAIKWQGKAVDLLAENDPDRDEYRKELKRYQAGKPAHRLGFFGEVGLSIRGLFAKNSVTKAPD